MAMIENRTLCSFTLGVVVIAAILASGDALAKKKSKQKDKSKATQTEEVEKTPQDQAREHYTKGKELYDLEKYDEALIEFNTAYDIKPHPTVLKSLAECQEAMGNHKDAVATLEKYLADPEAVDRASVEARVAEIKAKPISVSVTSIPEGATIAVAGTTLDKVTPAAIELTPGEYAITLSAEGYQPISKNISVVFGVESSIAVDFAKEGATPVPAGDALLVDPYAEEPIPTTTTPAVEEEKSGPPTAFWVVAAVTGVGLVTGTVFGTMALGDEEDYKEEPTPSKKDAGERDAIIADVSFGVAGAAAIAGIVILVTNARHKKSKAATNAARVWVAPSIGRSDVGLNTRISF